MRKGVAIGYIIALILGIVVIALIGIWLAVTGGKLGGQSLQTQCQTEAVQECIKSGGTGSAPLRSDCNSVTVEKDCKKLIK